MLGLQGEIVRVLEALRYANDYSGKSRSCIATLPIRERPAPCETVWKGPIMRKGPDFGPERRFAKTKVVRVSRDLQCTNDFWEESRSRTEELPIRERLSSFREGFGSRRGAAAAVFRGRRVAGGVEAGYGRNGGQDGGRNSGQDGGRRGGRAGLRLLRPLLASDYLEVRQNALE